MKIKMVKQSGNAVETEDFEAFDAEFKGRYDILHAEYASDMKIMHEKVEELYAELAPKYKTIIEVEYPKSAKQAKALVTKYGQYMVTTHVDSDELILVILDMGI